MQTLPTNKEIQLQKQNKFPCGKNALVENDRV